MNDDNELVYFASLPGDIMPSDIQGKLVILGVSMNNVSLQGTRLEAALDLFEKAGAAQVVLLLGSELNRYNLFAEQPEPESSKRDYDHIDLVTKANLISDRWVTSQAEIIKNAQKKRPAEWIQTVYWRNYYPQANAALKKQIDEYYRRDVAFQRAIDETAVAHLYNISFSLSNQFRQELDVFRENLGFKPEAEPKLSLDAHKSFVSSLIVKDARSPSKEDFEKQKEALKIFCQDISALLAYLDLPSDLPFLLSEAEKQTLAQLSTPLSKEILAVLKKASDTDNALEQDESEILSTLTEPALTNNELSLIKKLYDSWLFLINLAYKYHLEANDQSENVISLIPKLKSSDEYGAPQTLPDTLLRKLKRMEVTNGIKQYSSKKLNNEVTVVELGVYSAAFPLTESSKPKQNNFGTITSLLFKQFEELEKEFGLPANHYFSLTDNERELLRTLKLPLPLLSFPAEVIPVLNRFYECWKNLVILAQQKAIAIDITGEVENLRRKEILPEHKRKQIISAHVSSEVLRFAETTRTNHPKIDACLKAMPHLGATITYEALAKFLFEQQFSKDVLSYLLKHAFNKSNPIAKRTANKASLDKLLTLPAKIDLCEYIFREVLGESYDKDIIDRLFPGKPNELRLFVFKLIFASDEAKENFKAFVQEYGKSSDPVDILINKLKATNDISRKVNADEFAYYLAQTKLALPIGDAQAVFLHSLLIDTADTMPPFRLASYRRLYQAFKSRNISDKFVLTSEGEKQLRELEEPLTDPNDLSNPLVIMQRFLKYSRMYLLEESAVIPFAARELALLFAEANNEQAEDTSTNDPNLKKRFSLADILNDSKPTVFFAYPNLRVRPLEVLRAQPLTINGETFTCQEIGLMPIITYLLEGKRTGVPVEPMLCSTGLLHHHGFFGCSVSYTRGSFLTEKKPSPRPVQTGDIPDVIKHPQHFNLQGLQELEDLSLLSDEELIRADAEAREAVNNGVKQTTQGAALVDRIKRETRRRNKEAPRASHQLST